MIKTKIKLILGAVLFTSIILTGCSNANNYSGSSSEEDEVAGTPEEAGGDDEEGNGSSGNISTLSIPSLVSREIYYNVYTDPSTKVESEHWYYGSTNALTNYTVSTYKDIGTNGAYQEVTYVFSADPHFLKSGTGHTSMYDTDAFVSAYSPESNASYTGKYIYSYDDDGNCTQGAYIASNTNEGVTLGCFTAVYGDYGYLMFKEANTGSISYNASTGYTITPTASAVSEFRLCSYNTTTQQYDKEAFYDAVPSGWIDSTVTGSGTFASKNTAVGSFITTSMGTTTPDAHLITVYTCRYDSHNSPEIETKWEKRDMTDAPSGTAGNYAENADNDSGAVVSNTSASSVTISKVVYEFDTINYPVTSGGAANYVISLQKSYMYDGTASIPNAANISTDGSDYSTDGELSILSRLFDTNARKTRETETSYGNTVKTIVWQYDVDTTDEYGLASETTYNNNGLMVSRSNYNLLDTYHQDSSGNICGDTEKYETLNYEYNTTRGYTGSRRVWGITIKRPRTIHWSER